MKKLLIGTLILGTGVFFSVNGIQNVSAEDLPTSNPVNIPCEIPGSGPQDGTGLGQGLRDGSGQGLRDGSHRGQGNRN